MWMLTATAMCSDANDLNDFTMAEGAKRVVNGIQRRGTLTVVSGNPVQVDVLYADTGDTYEMRWSALIPRPSWSNDYYSAVGTNPTDGTGCTLVWLYNPGASAITVNYQYGSGASGIDQCECQRECHLTRHSTQFGRPVFTPTTAPNVFLPFSVTDCTGDGPDHGLGHAAIPGEPAYTRSAGGMGAGLHR